MQRSEQNYHPEISSNTSLDVGVGSEKLRGVNASIPLGNRTPKTVWILRLSLLAMYRRQDRMTAQILVVPSHPQVLKRRKGRETLKRCHTTDQCSWPEPVYVLAYSAATRRPRHGRKMPNTNLLIRPKLSPL